MRYILSALIAVLVLCAGHISAQSPTRPYRLGAVTTNVTGRTLADYPRFDVLRLGSSDQLEVSFDLLGGEQPQLYYRLCLCASDWTESPLMSIEYLAGSDEGTLMPPELSRGTIIPYSHYRLAFPNASVRPTRAGNYQLSIYDYARPEDPVLVIPFAVTEERVRIDAQQTPEAWMDSRGKSQQVNVYLYPTSGGSTQLATEVRLVVLQNARWDNAVRLSSPWMVSPERISYEGDKGARFPAGNNYHKIDHTGDKQIGVGVERVVTMDSGYLLKLLPQRLRPDAPYMYEVSHQGLQRLAQAGSDGTDLSRDYHWVQFSLNSDQPIGGRVLIEGEAFRYLSSLERTLTYVKGEGYQLILPLKVGYQEYIYRLHPDCSGNRQPASIEGDHYQTANVYTVLIYQQSPMDRTERLIGIKEVAAKSLGGMD